MGLESSLGSTPQWGLGRDCNQAQQLQLMMQSVFWANYPVSPDNLVDTGVWIGWLNVEFAPWIYSYSLGKYVYLPESLVGLDGSWMYTPK